MKKPYKILFLLISNILLGYMLVNFGPADVTAESSTDIIQMFRIPKMLTALFAGGGLALCGLMMQTYFQNPLAGPYVLGVHSGSTLAMAFWIMGASFFSIPAWLNQFASVGISILGAGLVLFFLLIVSYRIQRKVIILIIGIMIAYFASGILNILISVSSANELKNFMLWTLGSFQRVHGFSLNIFLGVLIPTCAATLLLIKPLNLLLLGEDYAKGLGVSLSAIKFYVIFLSALLCGVITAYCGPIAFLGVAAPHVIRGWLSSQDHRDLIPATFLMGALMAMLGEFLSSSISSSFTLPINAMMGIMGAPLIAFFLWKKGREGWS